MMRAEIWKAVQKLYAVGILVYFAAAGIVALLIASEPCIPAPYRPPGF